MASRRVRDRRPADTSPSDAIRRFIVRQLGRVACASCGHRSLHLQVVEPAVFLGGARLCFRCNKCAETSERLLMQQP